jgi:hypothetical protein
MSHTVSCDELGIEVTFRDFSVALLLNENTLFRFDKGAVSVPNQV